MFPEIIELKNTATSWYLFTHNEVYNVFPVLWKLFIDTLVSKTNRATVINKLLSYKTYLTDMFTYLNTQCELNAQIEKLDYQPTIHFESTKVKGIPLRKVKVYHLSKVHVDCIVMLMQQSARDVIHQLFLRPDLMQKIGTEKLNQINKSVRNFHQAMVEFVKYCKNNLPNCSSIWTTEQTSSTKCMIRFVRC